MTTPIVEGHIDILRSPRFADFADAWDRLLARSYDNRVFLTALWFELTAKHFGGDTTILMLRDDNGELLGALPLQVRAGALGFAGNTEVADYMDGLAQKAQAHETLVSLWRHAFAAIDFNQVDLRHVPSASPLIGAVQEAAASLGITLAVNPDSICPIAILCSNWDGYLDMLTKKQRHEIKRKLRRAEEGVSWRWRTVRTQEELHQSMPTFFALHGAVAGDKAGFMTPSMREFFEDLCRRFLDENILRLSFFEREGKDIACTLALLYRGRYMLYNSGYDPEEAALSPGIAAVAHTMQDAINERAVAFDFLSGDEPYKYQFGASDTRTCRIQSVN